jgi:RNA polymerase sigma-70 factor (ECF subfamily)
MRPETVPKKNSQTSDGPDHEAYMRLWVRHQSQVYAYIRALVYCRGDAEDILQEVAVVLWRKFDQFEPGSRFDQWAYRVARNQVLYYRQKRQRDRLVFGPELMDRIADEMAAARPAREGYLEALESCLDGVVSDDRALVRRRHEPGATNRSLSQALGRSESAISRALSRIYLALLQCVRGKMDPEAATGGDG